MTWKFDSLVQPNSNTHLPALLIDALQETDEKAIPERRYRVCACFGAILFLLVLILN